MSPEEVAAAVAEVRDRVRGRHQKTAPQIPDFDLPELDVLGRARDLADGKVASIGSVNPRPPGLINSALQAFKRLAARSLNWLVRDQVEFNRAAVGYMDRNIEILIEQNYNLLRLARELSSHRGRLDSIDAGLGELIAQQKDLVTHWSEWRPAWEEIVTKLEVRQLHAVREVEAAARGREEAVRGESLRLHQNYLEALSATTEQIQQKLWSDLAELKGEHERQIQSELRVIRRKQVAATDSAATLPTPATPSPGPVTAGAAGFDYARFEERFRGDEAFVAANQRFYLPRLAECSRVLDLGCGRGEFLELLAAEGKSVKGVDQDPEALAACREKGLDVEQGDLFEFLARQPDESFDGIVCTHVIEHLDPLRLPTLADLCAAKLRSGGVVAFETPNPGCLAIFAGDFYLDPTHQRPVPQARLHFHLQEAGFGGVEAFERHPAIEVFPELGGLDQAEPLKRFREKFFGGLDYAMIARKL